MSAQFRRWTPTIKLASLFLILFFLVTNFSSLWLFRQAQKQLEKDLKVKLQVSAARLTELLDPASSPAGRREIEACLADQGLIAVGFFQNLRPKVWTNPQNILPFTVDFSPPSAPAFSGLNSFGGHYTLAYIFPASPSHPAGFSIAPADQLGQLQKSFKRQMGFWVVGFLLTGLVVALLWRFILAPFEEMAQKANQLPFSQKLAQDDPALAMFETFEKIIAALKDKEAELSSLYRESEKKALHFSVLNRHLIESLSSGIVISDPHDKIIDFNPAAKELLALKKNPGLPPELGTVLSRARAGQPAESRELELEIGQKRKILAVSVSVISNPQGETLGKALLFSDLTGFKEMEKKLKENEHWVFLGETAAGLAHELRNALAVMLGYTKLLAKALGQKHPSRKTARELLKEARAAEETLKLFLDYARPQTVAYEKLDLKELLREIVAALKTQFADVHFRLILPSKIPCTGDPLLLKQIFSNLLRNGAEAAGKGGTVEAQALFLPAEKSWRIWVTDSGPGVPEALKEKIFIPFFTTKEEGIGLGLALVKKALHLLEGKIWIGTSPKGAVFVLTLPEKFQLRDNAQKDEIHQVNYVGRG